MDVFFHVERDAFDTLFDHAPDKLNVVKKVWESTSISRIDILRQAWPHMHLFSTDSNHLRQQTPE